MRFLLDIEAIGAHSAGHADGPVGMETLEQVELLRSDGSVGNIRRHDGLVEDLAGRDSSVLEIGGFDGTVLDGHTRGFARADVGHDNDCD